MKFNFKIIGLVMFVMLICCVSAASATDVDNITVPDDTDVIEIDDTVDSVDEVEQDRGTGGCDCSDCDCEIEAPTLPTRSNSITITTQTDLNNKFTGGVFNDASVDEVIFSGNFTSANYTTLNFNQSITITATGSNFTNFGFGLLHNGIVLNGATIIINAPQNNDSYAIDIESASNTIVINNKINYNCSYENAANYNYAIKAMNSENLTIYGNEINATVPLKQPDWYAVSTIASDFVAGVAVGSCDNFRFDKNNLTVIGNKRVGGFPTLDAFIIAQSSDAKIRGNNIRESDTVSTTNQYSYIYGIDVYSCDNIKICSNNVIMNGNEFNTDSEGNGTGAAYCVQLTGPHTGVKICNNNLTTRNQGPNLGIYSQNYYGETSITICGNHIDVTGKAGTDPWSLVSGMELQDTYANVTGNIIRVNNTAGYNSSNCAYGISYSQPTYSSDEQFFDITYNDVIVYNADWAVYIIENAAGNYVYYNNLTATTNNGNITGDNAVHAPNLDAQYNN